MLEGKSFEEITQKVMPDNEINKLRSKYFTPL